MKITAARLVRWAGLPAMAAGLIFIAIQPVHPADVLSSVTTGKWAIVTTLKTAMTFLGLLGIVGVYARQAEKVGWLGLAGFLLFSLFFFVQGAVAFLEAVVFAPLSAEAPRFVAGILGQVTGAGTEVSLGALPTVMLVMAALYVLGGLFLGISTWRAGILPRGAGGLLALAVVLTLAGPLLGHPLDRVLAVPMGMALIWLGYGLWSDRREPVSEPSRVMGQTPAPLGSSRG